MAKIIVRYFIKLIKNVIDLLIWWWYNHSNIYFGSENMINKQIKKLVTYGLQKELLSQSDMVYTINRILSVLKLDEFKDTDISGEELVLEDILGAICDYAVSSGIIEDSVTYRDLFDTELMGLLMPRPSEVIKNFDYHYSKSPKDATDYYYKLSCDSNYIRTYRVRFVKSLSVSLRESPPHRQGVSRQRTILR